MPQKLQQKLTPTISSFHEITRCCVCASRCTPWGLAFLKSEVSERARDHHANNVQCNMAGGGRWRCDESSSFQGWELGIVLYLYNNAMRRLADTATLDADWVSRAAFAMVCNSSSRIFLSSRAAGFNGFGHSEICGHPLDNSASILTARLLQMRNGEEKSRSKTFAWNQHTMQSASSWHNHFIFQLQTSTENFRTS